MFKQSKSPFLEFRKGENTLSCLGYNIILYSSESYVDLFLQ